MDISGTPWPMMKHAWFFDIFRGYFYKEWPIVVLNILGRASSTGTLSVCYIYSAEIFPTVIRNVGVGSSSVWARVGPMLAPYIAALNYLEPRLPIVVFGIVALVAGFLVSFLPETTDHKLPDTIEEGEEMGKGDTLWKCCRSWTLLIIFSFLIKIKFWEFLGITEHNIRRILQSRFLPT